MRQWAALGVGLLTWLLVGCVPGRSVNPTGWLTRLRPPPAPTGKDMVLMEIALLDCPVGDHFINDGTEGGLWSFADEQVVNPEHKAALEDNGFRVAMISGLIPDDLQELLTSKRSNVNPRQRQVIPGHSAPLLLGPTTPAMQFTMMQEGEPVQVNLEGAQCKLVAVPSFTQDGKVKIQFTPEIEHGERALNYHPSADGTGWEKEYERAKKTYANLTWDVTVAPNQYIVIGARFDQRQSLGFASFVQADPSNPVQRLLVIRTSRLGNPPNGGDTDAAGTEEEVCASRAPVLAVQAQTPWTAARASSR